jgi:hypothetical protein
MADTKKKISELQEFVGTNYSDLSILATDNTTNASKQVSLAILETTAELNEASIKQTSESKKTESDMELAESLRVGAEDKRATAEGVRKDNETLRLANEVARRAAETTRNEAETARASAESLRSAAETSRTSAEEERVEQESYRVIAETAREQEYLGLRDTLLLALSYLKPNLLICPTNAVELTTGSTSIITASLLPESTVRNIIFISSDTSVARVDATTGEVTAVAPGTCNIYVVPTCNTNLTKTITATVRDHAYLSIGANTALLLDATGATLLL